MAPPAEKPAALCVDALVEEPIAGAGDAARAASTAGSSAAEVAIVGELVDVAGGASVMECRSRRRRSPSPRR
eukprot:851639-Alexandrium_andersonii.AAC.1